MKKLSRKRKRYLNRSSKRGLRHKKRNRSYRLKKLASNSALILQHNRISNIKRSESDPGATSVTIKAAKKFSIINDANNVVKFVYKLKSYAKANYAGYSINVDLSEIERMDVGAICLLLSVVNELSYFEVSITGNIPTDNDCAEIFHQSGFLNHMRLLTGKTMIKSSSKNLIIKTGKGRTKNKIVAESLRKAVGTVCGYEEHYPPIYALIQELNGNSVEHAYSDKSKEHWILGINHDETNKKVIFTFADNGFGIIKTLRRQFTDKAFEAFTSEPEILEGAFNKKYGSRLGEINRNKGLPLVKRIHSNNEVKNLIVLTNESFLYLNGSRKVTISRNFSGTFFYWELDEDCIKSWKNKGKS